jgi:hypothetical protein
MIVLRREVDGKFVVNGIFSEPLKASRVSFGQSVDVLIVLTCAVGGKVLPGFGRHMAPELTNHIKNVPLRGGRRCVRPIVSSRS